MKSRKPAFQIVAISTLVAAALLALTTGHFSGSGHTREAALEKSSGALDGMTLLPPHGTPRDVKDAMFFRDGQFLPRECEDRCNYPPSAYFVGTNKGGHEFIAQIVGQVVSGTVTSEILQFYRTVGTVQEFTGSTAPQEDVANWRL